MASSKGRRAVSRSRSVSPPGSYAYNCDPGRCVFINNAPGFNDRPSGKRDEAIVKRAFTLLGFDVRVYGDLTAADIESIAEAYSVEEHKGAFFFIISSHGGEGDIVYGTDGVAVSVHDLQKRFYATKCPSLAGKPKVFMIDACRGNEWEGVYRFTSRAGPQSTSTTNRRRFVTNSANFMTLFASTRGHKAGCDENEGSVLIKAFVQVLYKASADRSLTDIMMEVQRRIEQNGARPIQTPERTSTMSRSYYITRNTPLNVICELEKKLLNAFHEWIKAREQTIRIYREVAEKLQRAHHDVNISRITGSSVSVLGGVMSIIGFVLTPFTAGAALPIAITGITLSSLGGATAGGASVADIVIEKKKIEEAQRIYNKDQSSFENLLEIIKEFESNVGKVDQRCPDIENNAEEFASITTQLFTSTLRTGNLSLRIAELAMGGSMEFGALAFRVGGTAARGVAGAAIALNVISVPIDIAEIIQSSTSLTNGSKTRVVTKLLDYANKLEEQKESVKKDIGIECM